MTVAAIMAAATCVLGPLSIPIPISPVPITLTNLAIYFTVCLLGWKLGTISYLVYFLIGLAGLPVFSGFSSGFGKLMGPTGGYLIGFIFMAAILGLMLGTVVAYLLGTFWLSYVANLSFSQALWAGVIPYLPGDFIKILLAAFAGPVIRRRLQNAGLLTF